MAKTAAAKKIFLVDAMGFIFRAYFAPMARLNSPQGVPTKVPYLFSNMLRKLAKEHAPDYLAVVFDTKEPTFRDKLFDKYKAQRPPMPDDLAVTAETGDRLVMGLAHKKLPVYGVQFHPESIASEHGHLILKNFLDIAADWNVATGRRERPLRRAH